MTVFITTKPVQSIAQKPPNPFPEIPDPFGYGQRAVDFLRSLKHPKSKLPGKAFQLGSGLIDPEDEDGCKGDCRQEGVGASVVSGVDASPIL